jgi:hypothetical protein
MTCNHPIPDPSCDVCGLQPLLRNHYFDGKLMTARHFQIEQEYLRGLHRRHNSFSHGTGAVCGTLVRQHPELPPAVCGARARSGAGLLRARDRRAGL